MEWGYEEKYDLLGILMKENYELDYSTELKNGFIVDITKDHEIGAIQILGWAQKFKIPKPQVRLMDINVSIEKEGVYCIVSVAGKLNDEIYLETGRLFL